MPREAPRRGDRPVALERVVHLLACQFAVVVDCESVARGLEGALPGARQDFPVSRRYRLRVTSQNGVFRLRQHGRPDQAERSAEAAVDRVVTRLHELAFAALAPYTKVHAGYAGLGPKRLLAVGPGRSGKTTLMTRLLYEGFAVHGDEMVLLRDGVAVAYPRRFGVRQPTLGLVPQVAALAPDWARAPSSHGYQVLALDPAAAGFAWHIEPGRVDVVLFLEPRHGQPSRLVGCPQHLMVQRVMAQSNPPSGGRRQWITDISAMINGARSYTLAFGELDSAVAAVRDVLA